MLEFFHGPVLRWNGVCTQGLVISAGKMTNTIVIRRDYLHFVSKYRRWEHFKSGMEFYRSSVDIIYRLSFSRKLTTVWISMPVWCLGLGIKNYSELKNHGRTRGVSRCSRHDSPFFYQLMTTRPDETAVEISSSWFDRFEKRHKNMTVHCSPCWQNVKEGDIVTVGQCRPLSKTVRFNVLEHEPCINTVRFLDAEIGHGKEMRRKVY